MIGTAAGSYKVLEKIGEGGMGTVYRAVDEMVERSVALKVLRTEIAQNAEVVERFRSEAIALARLNHPAIATLYSFFRQGDQYFMAMEFVPGETLEKQIAREGAMPWQKATEILLRILEGISHAHQMGILHRDLKPANIMITPDGGVKVTDFGIARVLNTVKLTREARVVGTLEYLAPERALGRPADARSDLYSLGIVYYEMLTGRLPFDADTDFALMRAQIEQAPPRPREIGVTLPQPIEAALMKALEKNPDDRFADAAEFAAAFREAIRLAGPPLGSQVKPTRVAQERAQQAVAKLSATDWRQAVRDPRVLVTAAATFTLLVLIAGAALIGRKPPPKPVQPSPVAQTVQRPPDSADGLVAIAPPVTLPAQPAAQIPEPAPPVRSAAPPVRPPERSPSVGRKEPARDAGPQPSERILAALEETDNPASAASGVGSRPLHWAGINRALRIDRVIAPAIITPAAERRGVSFRATPDQLIELRVAGATDPMLHAIVNGYRGPVEPAAPPPSASIPPPAPPPAPASLPNTAAPKIPSVIHLRDVRRLYVSQLSDNLDEALREAITKETKGRLAIAKSVEAGDAVMQIEVEDEQGNAVVGTAGRVFGLRNKHKAIVKIVDPRTKKVIWSAEAGDKQGILGRPFGDAVKRMASRIAKRLREDWDR
jgi:serine/threonine protein kinase